MTPEYTHATIMKGAAATVVRVHSSNPWLDFYVARDHGADAVEIAVSLAGGSLGEKPVRLVPTRASDFTTITICDERWRPATEADHPQITAALRRYAIMRGLLLSLIRDAEPQ